MSGATWPAPDVGAKEKGRQPRQGLATRVFNRKQNRTDRTVSQITKQQASASSAQQAPAGRGR